MPTLISWSKKVEPSGFGNRRDLVGRFLMDHPRGEVGSFDVKSPEILRRFGLHNVTSGARRYRFRHGFRLSPAVQREKGLLNCAAWLDEDVLDNDPWRAITRIVRGESRSVKDFRAVITQADTLVKGAFDLAVRRRGWAPRGKRCI